jgi:hypothetical protein
MGDSQTLERKWYFVMFTSRASHADEIFSRNNVGFLTILMH